jgi:hypothetical protein
MANIYAFEQANDGTGSKSFGMLLNAQRHQANRRAAAEGAKPRTRDVLVERRVWPHWMTMAKCCTEACNEATIEMDEPGRRNGYDWGGDLSRRKTRNQAMPSHSIPTRNKAPTQPGPALAEYATIAAITNATVMRCVIGQLGTRVQMRPNETS